MKKLIYAIISLITLVAGIILFTIVHGDVSTQFIKDIVEGNTEAVSTYLKAGHSPNVRDAAGNPALIVAVIHRRPHLVELLLKHQADVTLKNTAGQTAAELAQEQNDAQLIKLFNPAAVAPATPNLPAVIPSVSAPEIAESNLPTFSPPETKESHLSIIEPLAVTIEDRTPVPPQIDDKFPKIWQETYPRIDEITVLQDKHEQLPESAWFFKETKQSNQKKIDELVHEALEILGISYAREYALKIRELEANIAKARQNISDYREKRRGAPADSFFETTVDDYDEKIKKREEEIARYLLEIEEKKAQITQQLQAIGINTNPEQVDILLASIVGEQTVEMTVIFNNVKAINNELSQLMLENSADTQATRRYYGMYTVLLKILLTMQQQFIDVIQNDYLPKIQHKIVENQSLMAETRQLLQVTEDERRREMYHKNLSSQGLILQVAHLYQTHLTDQAKRIRQAQERLSKDFMLAMNTYQTVKISGELVDMIRTTNKQFDTLANLQMPELIPFENLQMKLEYEKLTKELRMLEIQ